jgi:hypothetical protein
VFSIGHWQPKIGDPSFVGWLTVGSYYVCAGLGLIALFKKRERDPAVRRFRRVIPVVLVVLGISKQLNLPGAVTEIARLVLQQLGAYEVRRALQVGMLVVGAVGLVFVIRRWATQRAFLVVRQRATPELICLAALGALALLRAISLHQVGALLSVEVFGVRISWIVELACLHALMLILLVRIFSNPSTEPRRAG